MNTIVLVPSRMASLRLPNKPMADIHGEPMIVHVWRRAIEADVGPVVVATDHSLIAQAIQEVGGRVILTRSDLPSGTDRIGEALAIVDPDRHFDTILNFQGDLPTISPEVSRATLNLLKDPEVSIGTPVALIKSDVEANAPSVVKMIGTSVAEGRFRALYFTRVCAPWGAGALYHHIGLYAWRRVSLEHFLVLPPSPLELREKLEQLRALEAGFRIDGVVINDVPLGVDTQEDLDRARAILARGI